MATETTFFQSGGITVTNARFIVGAQTFAMHGITSVEGTETPASYVGPLILIIFGVALTLNIFALFAIGIIGIMALGSGIWLFRRRKPTYAVILRTAGGEITAYRSENRNYISQIIQALNNAIIERG